MNSLLLVAATCVLGQVAQPGQTLPPISSPANSTVVPSSNGSAAPDCRGWHYQAVPQSTGCCNKGCCFDNLKLRQRLCSRFCGLFHRSHGCDCCAKQTVPPPPVKVCQCCTPKVQQATQPKLDTPAAIRKRYADKVGHEDDYSWVTGQLYYLHIDGGLWVVRYAAIDTEDKYGGSVVLAPAVSMHNFREGDLVSVRGEILNEGRASRYLGGPLYRASGVDMIDRAD